MKEILRQLPKMDMLLEQPVVLTLLRNYRRDFVVDRIRTHLDATRQAILSGEQTSFLLDDFLQRLEVSFHRPRKLRPVINATGVVLHTNLGRAPLSERVMDHVKQVTTGYSNLEYDLERGERGERYDHLATYFRALTGCEDVHIVNNNAAAVMLVLHCLAKHREVVVSRGELVEIGGSFRIPDIMGISRAKLMEVGTTNRTHLRDYEAAICDDTALLMKIHQSNYYIEGFTASVSTTELRPIADRYNIPIYEDLGSGYLVNLGFREQVSDLRELLKTVDVVSISGDKLLGGPQAGIILGKADLIRRLKKDQLTRALRVDKMTLAALEALLIDYTEQEPTEVVPTLTFLSRSEECLHAQARRLLSAIHVPGRIESGEALVGGGSLPKQRLVGPKIILEADHATALEQYLRSYEPPIITTIRDGFVQLDVRCLSDSDEAIIIEALEKWSGA